MGKKRRKAAKIEDPVAVADKTYIEDQTSKTGEWVEKLLECPHCNMNKHVYVFEDGKTCYCLSCDLEFDLKDVVPMVDPEYLSLEDSREDREIQESLSELISDDPEVVKRVADKIVGAEKSVSTMSLPQYEHKFSYGKNDYGMSNTSGRSYSYAGWQSCTHKPQLIIDGGTWGVWAGKKIDSKYEAKTFDVVLNLTFTSIKEPHIIPIPELEKYAEVDCQYKEIQIDWPDYGVVNLPRQFWVDLLNYIAVNDFKLLVFCDGGHGRTGTAIATMMCLALDYEPTEAIEWVRKNYCYSAIETEGQKSYIGRMAIDPEKFEKKEIVPETGFPSLNPSDSSSIKSVGSETETPKQTELFKTNINFTEVVHD